MRTTHLRPHLDEILELQHDLATRDQVLGAGITDMMIYHRIQAGAWQRVLPGVYLAGRGTLTPEQRRIAATLFTGGDGQLTGLGALHWYGFQHAPATEKVHLIVPHETRRRSTGFLVVQRTLSLDERARDTGLYRVASVPRAVVDAGRLVTQLRDVRAIMSEAVQRGLASPDALDAEIRRAARSRTALVRRALAEVVRGARSAPEAELQELVGTSKVLPPVRWNVRLVTEDGAALPTPDAWIEEGGIGLEVDSHQYHADPDGWRETLRRHNILSEYGALVLHFTPAQIRSEPARVLRAIEHAYGSRASLRARVCVAAPPR